eukprot:PhF_6_TR3464/c0_g2_i1/m.5069
MRDNVTVYIGGEPIGMLDVFEHANVHFETNMLQGNVKARTEKEKQEGILASKRARAMRKKARSFHAEGDTSTAAVPVTLHNPTDLYKTKPWEFIKRNRADGFNKKFDAMVAASKERKEIFRNGNLGRIPYKGTKPSVLPTKTPAGDPLGHRRRMEPEGLFGWLFGDEALFQLKVNYAYRPQSSKDLQKTLGELEKNAAEDTVDANNLRNIAEGTDLWEWNVQLIGEDKDSPTVLDAPNRNGVNEAVSNFLEGLATAFGPLGTLTADGSPIFSIGLGVNGKMLPLIVFRIDFNTKYTPMLKDYEFTISFYYQ